MFTQPQAVLLFLIVGVIGYWILPSSHLWMRRWWLVLVSMGLIAFESVEAVAACLAITVWTALGELAISKLRENLAGRRIAFWTSLAGLIVPLGYVDFAESPIVIIGLSYAVIKSVSVLIDVGADGQRAGFSRVLLLNSFFPIFSSGPIETRDTFSDAALDNRLEASDLTWGIYRIAEGFFLSFFIGQTVLGAILAPYTDQAFVNAEVSGWTLVWVVLLKFLFLYINFSGYTSIAVGMSKCFGLTVRENFNYPFLARNPEEFWNRWHISLGQFLSKYIYFRMVVVLKRPYLALVLAFMLVGLWHNIGVQYVLWGLGHGVALVVFLTLKRRYADLYERLPQPAHWLIWILGWALTMWWVALMSFMANAPSLEEFVAIMARLGS